ncbi:rod shape-determining protein MreC [Nocardiopsis baichengensis]|uniref:rod shape-determining protein MreC n=1 Tax=Nocardiopsis baichengensis TaxID=280240 RepID=UPI000347C0C0|nr:rod shape-determining protein MreC [Nocardiopsis baichengensis]
MRRDGPRPRLVLVLLVAASIALMVLDGRPGTDPVTAAGRAAAGAAFGPVAGAVSAAARPVADGYRALAAAPGAQERIEELEARNRRLSAELDAAEQDGVRSERLADLLHLSGLGGYEVVPAQAVTRMGSGGYAETVTLDVGARDGVAPDMTVVDGHGLVGRVIRASHATSTVLLFTDGASSVGARMEGSREIGAVHGKAHELDGRAPAVLELMQADARIEEGDRVVTMGSHNDAPFVPGVPLGTVTRVRDTPGALSRTAELRPAADLGALDVVGVVVAGPAEDPRDSVLPEKPDGDAARAPREVGR